MFFSTDFFITYILYFRLLYFWNIYDVFYFLGPPLSSVPMGAAPLVTHLYHPTSSIHQVQKTYDRSN